jgi:hypothetical protein
MDAYVQEVRKLENKFSGLEVHHVLREHNVGTDILSMLGSTRAQVPVGVFVQELKQPSIKSSPQVTTDAGPQQPDREVMTHGEDWREAYIDFIRDQRLPAGIDARSAEAARVMRSSKGFVLVDNKLYWRGAHLGILMKCVTKEDSYDILREIHEGVCGNHAASERWWGKHTELVSGGLPQCPMLRILCGDAKTANSSASSLTSQPTVSSPYHHPSLLLARAFI